MAWDDTGARQVAGQLADSFYLGNDPGGYFKTQMANKEMAMRQAQDARAQATHDAQMRDSNLIAEARGNLANAYKAPGMPIPAGNVGPDGMGPATPAGLSTIGPSQRQILNMQAQLAATMGDNASMSKLRAEGEGMDRKERQKSFMEPYTKLTDEELANHPTIRGMFNDNPDVKGTLVFDSKAKRWIVADYDGKGSVKTLKRGEIMAALGAHFDEQEGEFDASTKTRIGLDDRRYNQARQGVQDTNKAVGDANRMNVDDARLGIDRQRLGLEGSRLGLEQQRLAKPVLQQFIGADGQPVLLDMNKVPVDKQGMASLPEGVKFPKQSLDAATLLRFRSELIKNGMKPLEVEAEMARVTGGEDPVEKLARSLKAQSDSVEAAKQAKKERGMPQQVSKNPASVSAPPTPRRGDVGGGQARLPWEAPVGSWND